MKVAFVLLALVAVALSVKIEGCGDNSGVSVNTDYGKCFEIHSSSAIVTNEQGEGENATATFTAFVDSSNCTGLSGSETVSCTCKEGDSYKIDCDAAAGVIPSAILIIAAIMAHL